MKPIFLFLNRHHFDCLWPIESSLPSCNTVILMNFTVRQVYQFNFFYVWFQDIESSLVESETKVLIGDRTCNSVDHKLHIEMILYHFCASRYGFLRECYLWSIQLSIHKYYIYIFAISSGQPQCVSSHFLYVQKFSCKKSMYIDL